MTIKYDHKLIEKKWQKIWDDQKTWEIKKENSSPNFYVLDMFPYPSAEGLHVGHPEGYTASDILARYLRMKGYQVMHPMGFDSFGLPAENFAIKTGAHPAETTKKNINKMRQQIKSLGFSYDWSREVITSDPKYYKWTQWIFIQLFKKGLAYEAMAPINWCPKDKTGLANEEVINGKCERCGTVVTKKNIKQWLVKITDQKYINRLENGLDNLEWPDSIKNLQKNWIGRSEGADIDFSIAKKYKFVLLHGFQGKADGVFFPWLAKELKSRGYDVEIPELPNTNDPKEQEQVGYVLDNIKFDENTILFGHSLGATVAMKVLEKIETKISGLVLAGGFTEAKFKDKERPFQKSFDWKYNYQAIKQNVGFVKILSSFNDYAVPIQEGRTLSSELSGELVESNTNGDHFMSKKEPIILDNIIPNLKVFTTRPDTLFGATYMVLAPEHPLVDTLTTEKQIKEIEKYKKQATAKSDLDRTDLAREKTGVFTGSYAENPGNNKKIPIWVADYVLISYGTGAIMAVPAHDERDYNFATEYKLPIVPVIKPPRIMPKTYPPAGSAAAWGVQDADIEMKCWTGDGQMINTGEYDGMDSEKFREKIIQFLEKNNKGRKAINYKIRDWLFSRQRYWGEPIPIIHCEKCGHVPVPEEDLPLVLPKVINYQPTGTGESPLAAMSDWVNTSCPKCQGPAKRETNTMPQWAGSNWYFMRYIDPDNDQQLADPKKLKSWLPVNMYIGGAEHAVLHLLYARFIFKFLYDIGVVPKKCGEEPFIKLKNQGLIMGEDGLKMSKSRGNVINPDEIISEFGADSMRMYEMFMGPFEDSKPWSIQGIKGVYRFLNKLWGMQDKIKDIKNKGDIEKVLHKLIKKITSDIENFNFNTAVSSFMETANVINKQTEIPKEFMETLLILLSPFAPHISEEMWAGLGHDQSINLEQWPKFDESKIIDEKIQFIVQVNGKLRDNIIAAVDSSESQIKELALASPSVKKYVTSKPKKIIFIKGRLINFVI